MGIVRVDVGVVSDREMRLPELFRPEEWEGLARQLGLSKRQAQIARLICQGHGNRSFATALRISLPTVRMHRSVLFKKLHITDRIGVPIRLVLAWKLKG